METALDQTIFKPKGAGNSIFTIFPYKKQGQWMFNDDARDVYEESFVAGADGLLDLVCKGADKCKAIFSAEKFPNYDLTLALIEGHETGSGDYFCPELKHDLWLCSCLGRYFEKPPKTIYVSISV